MLTRKLAGNRMRSDTYRICILMRNTETALNACTVELNAGRSNLTRERELRIKSKHFQN